MESVYKLSKVIGCAMSHSWAIHLRAVRQPSGPCMHFHNAYAYGCHTLPSQSGSAGIANAEKVLIKYVSASNLPSHQGVA